jgi:hypothetical protein
MRVLNILGAILYIAGGLIDFWARTHAVLVIGLYQLLGNPTI